MKYCLNDMVTGMFVIVVVVGTVMEWRRAPDVSATDNSIIVKEDVCFWPVSFFHLRLAPRHLAVSNWISA